jgi:hypothetical protein
LHCSHSVRNKNCFSLLFHQGMIAWLVPVSIVMRLLQTWWITRNHQRSWTVNLIQHQTTVSKNNFGGAKMCDHPPPSCSEWSEFAFESFECGNLRSNCLNITCTCVNFTWCRMRTERHLFCTWTPRLSEWWYSSIFVWIFRTVAFLMWKIQLNA